MHMGHGERNAFAWAVVGGWEAAISYFQTLADSFEISFGTQGSDSMRKGV